MAKPKPDLSHIAEPLRSLAVPIESLTPDPENARVHRPENLEALRKSLGTFGQRLPFIVQKDGMIVRVGNARLSIAKELSWTHVACVVTDDPDSIAKAFAIADNRAGELGTWNDKQLASLLDSLQSEADDLIKNLGFDDHRIERLLDRFAPPDSVPPEEPLKDSEPQPYEPPPSVGIRYISLTYSTPDHERLVGLLDYLKDHYGTDNVATTVLTSVEDHVAFLQEQKARSARVVEPVGS